QHKIVGGDTKRVLRRAMTGYLPEGIRRRRDKLGFNTPQESWFRGPLRQLVESGVRETLERYPGLLNRTETLSYLNAATCGQRSVEELWRIINFGIWGRLLNIVV